MIGHRNSVAASKINDVAVLEIPFVDLLIVDIRSVRGIPIDEHDPPVDRHYLGMQTRHLRVFQYDLTNRRFTPDPDPRPTQPQPFTRPVAIEDREPPQK